MKFNCKKEDLVEAVSIVQKVIKNNPTIKIIDGIFIEVNDRVKLTGYDMETGIECDLVSDIEETGSVVINSKIFGDIIRSLPEEFITISTDDKNRMKIVSGNAKFDINGTSSEGYPKLPVVDIKDKITVSQKMLKNMINSTIFAVSKDDTRKSLTGCLLQSDGSTLTMAAIDGFRMAIRRSSVGEDFPKMEYIIPGKALSESAKIFGDSDDTEVNIYASSNQLLFDIGDVRIVSRLIQGPFVNYASIITKNPKSIMTVRKNDLLKAVERAALVISTDERRNPVTLKTGADNTTLSVSSRTEFGNSNETIEITLEGDSIDVDFNNKYIIDALKNIEDETVKIEFNGAQGPCITVPEEGDSYLYLILPLRR